METIPHRELRNNSSKILARVRDGEAIAVTNHGETVAILTPPEQNLTELDRLRAAGQVRTANPGRKRLTDISRARGLSSQQVLDDIRGSA